MRKVLSALCCFVFLGLMTGVKAQEVDIWNIWNIIDAAGTTIILEANHSYVVVTPTQMRQLPQGANIAAISNDGKTVVYGTQFLSDLWELNLETTPWTIKHIISADERGFKNRAITEIVPAWNWGDFFIVTSNYPSDSSSIFLYSQKKGGLREMAHGSYIYDLVAGRDGIVYFDSGDRTLTQKMLVFGDTPTVKVLNSDVSADGEIWTTKLSHMDAVKMGEIGLVPGMYLYTQNYYKAVVVTNGEQRSFFSLDGKSDPVLVLKTYDMMARVIPVRFNEDYDYVFLNGSYLWTLKLGGIPVQYSYPPEGLPVPSDSQLKK